MTKLYTDFEPGVSGQSIETVDLDALFQRPGRTWNKTEVRASLMSLYSEPQYERLVSLAQKRLGPWASRSDAEDAWAQFATYRLASVIWSYDPKKEGYRSFKNWVSLQLDYHCRKLHQEALKTRALEQPMVSSLEDGSTLQIEPEDSWSSRLHPRVEAQDLLQKALQCLDSEDRSLFVARYLEEKALADIAAHLDIPVGTVKSRLYMLRSVMREAIRKLQGSPS